jgi:UDP-N-acetylglucosamine 2-epimerase (non-hydrolysing)
MSTMSPAPPAAADGSPDLPTMLLVGGGPSSFLRVAAVAAAVREHGDARTIVVHSGRPQDGPALDGALAALGAGAADLCLGLAAPTPGAQTGTVLVEVERVLRDTAPALVVVAGGLDSTLGCALAASKARVPVVHLDAGLRSFDWSTADEINRVLTDRLAQTLLTSSSDAGDNLLAEGVPAHAIHHVGNTLVDVVRRCEDDARALRAWEAVEQVEGEYVLVSLHRPEHLHSPMRLASLARSIAVLGAERPVVLSLDGDTREQLGAHGELADLEAAGVRPVERLDYLPFLSLLAGAGAVITDSGAIQDETSAMGVACFTLRAATDRPITISHGTNALLGDGDPVDLTMVVPAVQARCAAPLWDGNAARRAADVLAGRLAMRRAAAAHA